MSDDDELDRWRAAWKADAAGVEDLRRRVERDSFRLRLSFAGDLLAGVLFLGAATWLGLRYPSPPILVLAAVVWVLTLVAVGYSVRHRLAVLRPSSESVKAFVEITRARRTREVRAANFGLWLLLFELVFLLVWLSWNRDRDLFPDLGAVSSAWRMSVLAIPVVCYLWLERMRRRARRELSRLDAFEREDEL